MSDVSRVLPETAVIGFFSLGACVIDHYSVHPVMLTCLKIQPSKICEDLFGNQIVLTNTL